MHVGQLCMNYFLNFDGWFLSLNLSSKVVVFIRRCLQLSFHICQLISFLIELFFLNLLFFVDDTQVCFTDLGFALSTLNLVCANADFFLDDLSNNLLLWFISLHDFLNLWVITKVRHDFVESRAHTDGILFVLFNSVLNPLLLSFLCVWYFLNSLNVRWRNHRWGVFNNLVQIQF